MDSRQQGGPNTSKGSNAKFLNPGFTSAQLQATIKQHVSSTLDDSVSEYVPETYLHSIIFMEMLSEMEVTDKPHKNDDLRIQHAQAVYDNAARSRLLTFRRPRIRNKLEVRQEGDGQTERQLESTTSQILQTYKDTHPFLARHSHV